MPCKRLFDRILHIGRLNDCGEKGTKSLHVLAQLIGYTDQMPRCVPGGMLGSVEQVR